MSTPPKYPLSPLPSTPPLWAVRRSLGPISIASHGYSYEPVRSLGAGSFGAVKLCHRTTSASPKRTQREMNVESSDLQNLYAVKSSRLYVFPQPLITTPPTSPVTERGSERWSKSVLEPMSNGEIFDDKNFDDMPPPPTSPYVLTPPTSPAGPGADTNCAEADVHASLYHPNVTLLYELITNINSVELVCEYCPLGSLDENIDVLKRSPVLWSKVLPGLLSGLEYLKSKGIAHRDVKGSNVLLSNYFTPRLCDFGSATIVKDEETGIELPRMHEVVGSVGFLSPEECKMVLGEGHDYDVFKGDLWSAGVTMLHALGLAPTLIDGNDDLVGVCRGIIAESSTWLQEGEGGLGLNR